LHRSGVEIISVFHDAGANVLKELHAAADEVTRQTRKQYQRLASLPLWSWTTDSLWADKVLSAWAPVGHPLGRGACPGFDLTPLGSA
jgi:hypothetical protein